jgi:hypothetical protein
VPVLKLLPKVEPSLPELVVPVLEGLLHLRYLRRLLCRELGQLQLLIERSLGLEPARLEPVRLKLVSLGPVLLEPVRLKLLSLELVLLEPVRLKTVLLAPA